MGGNQQRTILTTPISIGDVSGACGRSGSDLGDLIANGTLIKKMAKYKPFKNSHPGFTNYNSARIAARYGLTDAIPELQLRSSNPVLINEGQYDKPGTGLPNEYFRMLDFDGYYNNACDPLYVEVGQLTYGNSDSIVNLYINSATNYRRTDGKFGDSNSLSVADLLDSGTNKIYTNNIAFIFHNVTKNTFNLVITNITFSALAGNPYNGIKNFVFKNADHGETASPGIPILSSTNQGDTFNVIVCVSSMQPDSGKNYKVITSFDPTITVGSVNFENGCDRTSAKLISGEQVLDGTKIKDVTVTPTLMTSHYEYPASSGQLGSGYRIVVTGKIDTTDAAAGGPQSLARKMDGAITINTSPTWKFGPTPASNTSNLSGGLSEDVYSKTVDPYARDLFTAEPSQYLGILEVPLTTTVTASLNFTTPFNEPLCVPGTATITMS